jgi:hypothetical protein
MQALQCVTFATSAFRMWEGWNMTTRRAETGIISPVFGLRPGRLFLLRRQNTRGAGASKSRR